MDDALDQTIHILALILNGFAETADTDSAPWGRGSHYQRERIAAIARYCAQIFAGDIIEIGCLHGSTTVLLAAVAREFGRRVIAVDPWEVGRQEIIGGEFDIFLRTTAPYCDIIDIIRLPSQDPTAVRAIAERKLCFAFVDGRHAYAECLADIDTVSHCEGIIAVDDVQWNDEVALAFERSKLRLGYMPIYGTYIREAYLVTGKGCA